MKKPYHRFVGHLSVLIFEAAGNFVIDEDPSLPVVIVEMGKLVDQFCSKQIIALATSPYSGLESLSEVYPIPVSKPGGRYRLSIPLEFRIIEEAIQSFKPEPNRIFQHVYTSVTAIWTNTLKTCGV